MPAPDSFRFKPPFARPQNVDQQAANWRALERWASAAPFYDEVVALRGLYSGGSIWLYEDPVDEPWNGDGAATTRFDKFDAANNTVVTATVWAFASSVDSGGKFIFSLHFEGITNSFDAYYDVAFGTNNNMLMGKQLLDGLPPGSYTVTLVVTTTGLSPYLVAVSELEDGGFSLRETLPPNNDVELEQPR